VKGKWQIGDDVVADSSEYVAHIDQLVRGWVRFEDGKVTDRRVGKVADGFKPQPREELGDNDPKKWKEKDADDNPRDPWVKQWFLPLIGVETGDVVCFVSGSNGGNNAVSNLCCVYGHRKRDGANRRAENKQLQTQKIRPDRRAGFSNRRLGWHATNSGGGNSSATDTAHRKRRR
jgi:hypothetical protein